MNDSLTMTVLTENTPTDGLCSEHGLSLHLCYARADKTVNVLLDFGQSDAFAHNADVLGVDLDAVDVAVLSHAHYDHANGMATFCEKNDHAPIYLSAACGEKCWSTKGGTASRHYIGIELGMLARHPHRLARVSIRRPTTIAPGVHLVPHTTPGLAEVGKRSGMWLKTDDEWEADGFLHELSLVVELAPATDGTTRLAVFNSCSHAGLAVVATEVAQAFCRARIVAYVGGLHLVHATDEEVLQVADAARRASIERIYTGHCTGDAALALLRQELPGQVFSLHPGLAVLMT